MSTQYTMILVDKTGNDIISLNDFDIGIIEGLHDIKNDIIEQDSVVSDGTIFDNVYQTSRQIIFQIGIVGSNRDNYVSKYNNLRKFLIKHNQFQLLIKQIHPIEEKRQWARIKVAIKDFSKVFINAKFISVFNLELYANNPLYEIYPRVTYSNTDLSNLSNGYGWQSSNIEDIVGKYFNRWLEVITSPSNLFLENKGETLGDVIFEFSSETAITTTLTISNKTRGLPGSTLIFGLNLLTNETLFFSTKTGKLIIINNITKEETNAYDNLISGNAYDFKLLPGINEFEWSTNNTDFGIKFELVEYLRTI